MWKRLALKTAGFLGYTIQYGCIAHCTFEYVGDFVICTGPSMEPTIYTNDIIFTEHFSVRLGRIDRGDIVIAKCPTNPKQMICKRVLGIAGDRIDLGLFSSQVVPKGHVWLAGDNVYNSTDSRNYGPVPQGLIRSRVLVRIWPLNEMSFAL